MVLLFLYEFFWIVLSPLWVLLFWVRWLKKKEDHKRFKERLGFAGRPRPEGRLIWMHGASVGECLSMLPLIQKLLDKDSKLHIMVTSGTVTSANLMAKRLPERAFHQFIPIDSPWGHVILCGIFMRMLCCGLNQIFGQICWRLFIQQKSPLYY